LLLALSRGAARLDRGGGLAVGAALNHHIRRIADFENTIAAVLALIEEREGR